MKIIIKKKKTKCFKSTCKLLAYLWEKASYKTSNVSVAKEIGSPLFYTFFSFSSLYKKYSAYNEHVAVAAFHWRNKLIKVDKINVLPLCIILVSPEQK